MSAFIQSLLILLRCKITEMHSSQLHYGIVNTATKLVHAQVLLQGVRPTFAFLLMGNSI